MIWLNVVALVLCGIGVIQSALRFEETSNAVYFTFLIVDFVFALLNAFAFGLAVMAK